MNLENMVKGVCVDYTYDGLGIIKIDGEVLFAKNLIIGEEAKVRVLKKEKNYMVVLMKHYMKVKEMVEIKYLHLGKQTQI